MSPLSHRTLVATLALAALAPVQARGESSGSALDEPARRTESASTRVPATDAPPREPLRLGFAFGSKPGEIGEAALDLWFGSLKKTSDFGFGVPKRGRRAPRYVQDLGFETETVSPGVRARVNLGVFGWLGGDVVVLAPPSTVGVMSSPKQVNGFELAQGDVCQGRATWIWGRGHYGYDFRYRLEVAESVPLELCLAPTIGFGVYDLDARLRRLFPTPGPRVGGHMTAWCVAPGLVLGAELLDTFRLGLELEFLPGVSGAETGAARFPVSSPALHEWERVHVFAGVRLFGVEATIGYQFLNSSAAGGGNTSDVKLRAVDVSLGVRF